ncbi:hypothetical protein, partial [Pseudomonas proteolytica]|uniref:hypothetical protein n=1 Tax=Pseudomonas proteolytica TaxID=219574 RepID=UPI001F463BA4
HFHADHPVFSCSKSEQKQLNTWVSFQSAEQPLLGQFSVSGNSRIFLSVFNRPNVPAKLMMILQRCDNQRVDIHMYAPTLFYSICSALLFDPKTRMKA